MCFRGRTGALLHPLWDHLKQPSTPRSCVWITLVMETPNLLWGTCVLNVFLWFNVYVRAVTMGVCVLPLLNNSILFKSAVSKQTKLPCLLQGVLLAVHPTDISFAYTRAMLVTQHAAPRLPRKPTPRYFSFIWAGLLLVGFHSNFHLSSLI